MEHGTSRPIDIVAWLPESRRSSVISNALDHPDALAELGHDAAPHDERIQVWFVTESIAPATRNHVLGRRLALDQRIGRSA